MKSKKIAKKLQLNKLTVSHLELVQAGGVDLTTSISCLYTPCCPTSPTALCGTCYITCANTCDNKTCDTCYEYSCAGWTNCAGGVAC